MRQALTLVALVISGTASAASTLDKTPSIDTPAPANPGTFDFFFSHNFSRAGEKLINSPTFNFELGILPRLSAEVQYASSSDINGNVNEAFPALKFQPLAQDQAQPLDLTVVAGYDSAAKSVDGELIASRTFGPIQPFLVARGFSDGYGLGGGTFAGSVGVAIHLLPRLAVVGDVGKVLAANDLDAIKSQYAPIAWSGGIAFELPYTPHTISFFATNVNTHTPEGASRGGFGSWRFGFEFDVPIRNIARFAAIFAPHGSEPAHPAPSQTAAGEPHAAQSATSSTSPAGQKAAAVQVKIADMKFAPEELRIPRGTTVEWVNGDDVEHTATADDESWDSGTLAPGQSWKKTFDQPGRYPYYCEVHPFMTGTVMVE